MAELIIHRDQEAWLRLRIDRDSLTLGSDDSCDLSLPPAATPDCFFRLLFHEEVWQLETLPKTLSSEAGVEGHGKAPTSERQGSMRVAEASPQTLGEGDTLPLQGGWSAVFHLGAATAPGETRLLRGQDDTRAIQPLALETGRVQLRWQQGDEVQTCALKTKGLTLGTDDANSVVLIDPFASAFHARLTSRDGSYWIEDLNSTNGTWVGAVRVQSSSISPGVTLRLGEQKVFFEEISSAGPSGRYGILTGDPSLKSLLNQLERVAKSDATVTVFGESGTGKELVARAIHTASPRAEGPYIPVNCAAISKSLMESELFGHERGAFTGAASRRAGAFEEAAGGTLFLDEIGELPLDLQAKLLRALELKEITRVGSSKPLKVDVRIVAATNRDLAACVKKGAFREDLFYRLYVVPLTLPPLRQRRGDVKRLANYFVEQASMSQALPSLSPKALARLEAHSWPGNVRELKNTLERAMLLRESALIDEGDISFARPPLEEEAQRSVEVVGRSMNDIVHDVIRVVMASHGGNRRRTAASLQIARSTLQARLREMGLVRGEADDSEESAASQAANPGP